MYLDNVFVGQGFMWLIVFGIFEEDLVHIRAGILVQFVAAAEDYEGDLAIAQHRQFVRLLHHAEFSFVECNLENVDVYCVATCDL